MPVQPPVIYIASEFQMDRVSVCQRGKNPGSRISVMKAEKPEKDPVPTPAPTPTITITAAEKADLDRRMATLEQDNAVLRTFAQKTAEETAAKARAGIVAKAASMGLDAAELDAFLSDCQKAGLGEKAIALFGKSATAAEKAIPTTPLGWHGDGGGATEIDGLTPSAQARVNKHRKDGVGLDEAVYKAFREAADEVEAGNQAAVNDYLTLSSVSNRRK